MQARSSSKTQHSKMVSVLLGLLFSCTRYLYVDKFHSSNWLVKLRRSSDRTMPAFYISNKTQKRARSTTLSHSLQETPLPSGTTPLKRCPAMVKGRPARKIPQGNAFDFYASIGSTKRKRLLAMICFHFWYNKIAFGMA